VCFSQRCSGGVHNPAWAHAILTVFVIIAFMLIVPWSCYEILLNIAHKAGVCNPEWLINAGNLSALIIVCVCFFYGREVLQKMRPKAETFVAGVMAEQTRIYGETAVK